MPISVVEQYYQTIEHLDKADKIILAEKIMNSIKQESKPLNDLFKFQPRTDVVVGNSDDFVSMSWEKELNFDLPK